MNTLEFQGYWRDVNANEIPDEPGIFCVYGGTYDGSYVYPKKLIFIGESSDARVRIAELDKNVLESHLSPDEILMYSIAKTNSTLTECLSNQNKRRVYESQLINENKPPANANVPSSAPGVSLSHYGQNACL